MNSTRTARSAAPPHITADSLRYCLANAEDFDFGDFGTLGTTHSDNNLADYRADKPFATKGQGRTAAWDAGLGAFTKARWMLPRP